MPRSKAGWTRWWRRSNDPQSPYYHQWLTPKSYAQRFGISQNDLAQVTDWLQAHGMSVDEVTPGSRSVIFSATAGQVASAFHTQINTYRVQGELHHANATDPEIPQALAAVVAGVVSLHDFRSQPMHVQVTPEFPYGSAHYLGPADFATIYDAAPLYQQSVTGSGQSVAIVGRSNINLSDVRLFRNTFGLPANDPQIILNGANPGILNSNEEIEADLDVQWSGAVAPNAAVKFVVSASTSSSDGVFLSSQYIVNHNVAPVMSVSFGLCEAALGSSGNSFFNSLWQQAAAEGITVFVSSGDSGAAGCDSSSATNATGGRAVNGLCSSPYSVCVGGTQFNDTASPSTYWSSTNSSSNQSSALSYIPESAWNESGSSGLWSTGGGSSSYYAKPSWQTGMGVPADGRRDVPDVALTAAGHDAYLVYMNGGLMAVGGTSAASPSFAGLMALVVQSAGARQGNANPAFYALANRQRSAGGAAVFHDPTTGNNSVPGVTGYNAGPGYDLATGLGSVDANLLAHHWGDASAPPAFQLSASVSSLALTVGTSANVNLTVSGAYNATVSLSVSGLPSGVTSTLTPASFPSPGTGSSVLKLTAASSAKLGTYAVNLTAASGATVKTVPLTLTVNPLPNYTLAVSPASISLAAGKSVSVTLTTAANSTFSSGVNLAVTGLPAGMTAKFALASIAAPGSGTTTLALSAGTTVAPSAYPLSVTAIGGGITQTVALTVNTPGFTLAESAASVSVPLGGKGTVTLTTRALGGFSSAVALTASGMPAGVTASYSPQSVAAPGNGSSTLTLAAGSAAKTGTPKLTVTATGGGVTQTTTLTLNVTSATATKPTVMRIAIP